LEPGTLSIKKENTFIKLEEMDENLKAFEELLHIMDELRLKCPWDKKQTLESLRTLTIEETYELADAILKDNKEEIKKELGDLLLHIVFYAKIGSETNDFNMADICKSISEKLIYRHPHIFSDVKVADAREVEENWEQLKLKEKGGKGTVLQGVPRSLPAMVKANRIQDKVRGVGFDWEEKEQVWDKVKEEISELEVEMKAGNQNKIEQEFGDLFFSLINTARLYGVNPENALERTNQKFTKRFNYLESQTMGVGRNLKEMSLEEMDVIWEKAKQFDS
jgi:XTP/dITP diphosphohydrolase